MANKKKTKKVQSQCDMCAYFDYDDDYEEYVCIMNMDEDEAVRYYGGSHESCPYFRFYDEYKIVQKQN